MEIISPSLPSSPSSSIFNVSGISLTGAIDIVAVDILESSFPSFAIYVNESLKFSELSCV